MMTIFILISLFLALARVAGLQGQAFQAVAHMWMGFLIGVAIYSRVNRTWSIWLIITLSVVEVICFLAFRK